jgi:hypothetical protein
VSLWHRIKANAPLAGAIGVFALVAAFFLARFFCWELAREFAKWIGL